MIAAAPATLDGALLAFHLPPGAHPARRCGDPVPTRRNASGKWMQTPVRRRLQPSVCLKAQASADDVSRTDDAPKPSAAHRRPPLKVGCLHGSRASGRDVEVVLDRVRPGAVVLELCESRHRSLRRDLEKGRREKIESPLKMQDTWHEEIKDWTKGIGSTTKRAGLAQGLLAALLSAPYLLQRLGDFDPGLEFKVAMTYADASARRQPENVSWRFPCGEGKEAAAAVEAAGGEGCALVLGDRDVQETLRRIGGGGLAAITGNSGEDDTNTGINMMSKDREGGEKDVETRNTPGFVWGVGDGMQGFGDVKGLSLPSDWTMASDARVLRMAVVGPQGSEWPDSLNVFDTIWRERQALGGLLLPVTLVLAAVIEVVQRSVGGAASAAMVATGGQGRIGGIGLLGGVGLWQAEVSRLLNVAGDVWETAFVVWSVWYMLRFFRLIIKERDDVLSESIIKTCREHPGRPVVAVLGLLHCNGVADNLRRFASTAAAEHAVE